MRPALGANPGLPAPQIASVLISVSQLGLRPSNAWLGAVLSSLEMQLDRLLAPELGAVLTALARLGTRPTSPWMAMHEAALSAHAASLTAADLVAVVAAYGDLKHRPRGKLLRVLVERSQAALQLMADSARSAQRAELEAGGTAAASGGSGGQQLPLPLPLPQQQPALGQGSPPAAHVEMLDTQQLVQLVSGLAQMRCQPGRDWQDAFWQVRCQPLHARMYACAYSCAAAHW